MFPIAKGRNPRPIERLERVDMKVAEQKSRDECPQENIEENEPPELAQKGADRQSVVSGHSLSIQGRGQVFYPQQVTEAKDFVDGSIACL